MHPSSEQSNESQSLHPVEYNPLPTADDESPLTSSPIKETEIDWEKYADNSNLREEIAKDVQRFAEEGQTDTKSHRL
jgi:hypothetical protein